MKKLVFSYITFFLLISLPIQADSCYVTYENMPSDVSVQYQNQSFSCESFQTSIADFYINSQFADKLDDLEVKAERLKKSTDELNNLRVKELAEATKASIEEVEAAIEAAKDTGEMSLRCVAALRLPNNAKIVFKCIDEIFEADNSLGEFIEKYDDAETSRILLRASNDLVIAYKELEDEWEKQKKRPLAQKAEFERRCSILKNLCLIESAEVIEIKIH